MFFFIAKLNSPRARRAPMNVAEKVGTFGPGGQGQARAEAAGKGASGWKQIPLGRSVPCSSPRVNKRSKARRTSCTAGRPGYRHHLKYSMQIVSKCRRAQEKKGDPGPNQPAPNPRIP